MAASAIATRLGSRAGTVRRPSGECVEGVSQLPSLRKVESVDQVAPDGCRVDWPGGVGAVAAGVGEPDLDASLDPVPCDQAALLHAG
jgi:hypothetical protein